MQERGKERGSVGGIKEEDRDGKEEKKVRVRWGVRK